MGNGEDILVYLLLVNIIILFPWYVTICYLIFCLRNLKETFLTDGESIALCERPKLAFWYTHPFIRLSGNHSLKCWKHPLCFIERVKIEMTLFHFWLHSLLEALLNYHQEISKSFYGRMTQVFGGTRVFEILLTKTYCLYLCTVNPRSATRTFLGEMIQMFTTCRD